MKKLIVSVLFLFNVCFSASVLTGDSYFDTIYSYISSAKESIEISVSELQVSSKNNEGAIEILRALQRAAIRGVKVDICFPVGSLSKGIVEKMADQGVNMACSSQKKTMDYIKIDDVVIYGVHEWRANRQKENFAVLFERGEYPEILSGRKVLKDFYKYLKKAHKNVFMSFSDVSLKHLKKRKKAYKLILKKENLDKYFLFSQKTIKKTEISKLFQDQEPNIIDAMYLYEKQIDVSISKVSNMLGLNIFGVDDNVFFQTGIDSYVFINSDILSEKTLSFLKSLPQFKIKDIVQYN